MFTDKTRDDLRADLTDAEVKQLMPWLVPVDPRPGRRGGVQSRFKAEAES